MKPNPPKRSGIVLKRKNAYSRAFYLKRIETKAKPNRPPSGVVFS